jgi:hypothetical protein
VNLSDNLSKSHLKDLTNMTLTFQYLVDTAPQIVKEKLEQLKTLRERPDYHPEPSTYHHIEIVVNRLLQTGDPDLAMAGMLHDICKLDCVKIHPKSGHPTSPGHDAAASDLIMQSPEIQQWIRDNGADETKVAAICLYHMRFHQLGQMRPFKREAQIQKWTDQGIWKKLQYHGAADNMLVEFDMDDLDKSFKFNK